MQSLPTLVQPLDSPQCTRYDWNSSSGQKSAARFEVVPGKDGPQLQIVAQTANDARFVHQLRVEPNTVYRFACQARGENIGTGARGAGISVADIPEGSPDISGSSQEWRSLEFYGKTGAEQQTLSVTVGLGGYGSLNSGLAWFRNIQVEKVANPPPGVRIVALQPQATPAPALFGPGHAGGAVIVALGLFGLLLAIWGSILRRRNRNGGEEVVDKSYTIAAPLEKIEAPDLALMVALSAVCLLVSLYNLGGHLAPETGWQPAQAGESVTIELSRETDLARLYYYCGINERSGDGSRYSIAVRNPAGIFIPLTSFTKNDVNIWKYSEMNVRTSAVRLLAETPGGRLNEIALVEKGSQVPLTGLKTAE